MAKIEFKEGSFGFFAEMDYEDLQSLLAVKPVRCRPACFYCQQCIEKYLKHVIRLNGEKLGAPILQGHNILRLALFVQYPDAEKYRSEFISLGKLYFDSRYPHEEDGYMFIAPTPQEVTRAVEVTDAVRNWVMEIVTVSKQEVKQTLKGMDLLGNSK